MTASPTRQTAPWRTVTHKWFHRTEAANVLVYCASVDPLSGQIVTDRMHWLRPPSDDDFSELALFEIWLPRRFAAVIRDMTNNLLPANKPGAKPKGMKK